MPLYQRQVLPVTVGRSQGHGPSVLVSSHEESANRMMANIIRQLGSIGLHANDIFGEEKEERLLRLLMGS